MKNLNILHDKAMEIAQKSFLAQKNGKLNEFKKLSKEAFELEKQAAMLLKENFNSEPNRSILFKSAAFLAYDADEIDECKKMIILALFGKADQEIKDELFELFSEISEKNSKSTLVSTIQYNVTIVNPLEKFPDIYSQTKETDISRFLNKKISQRSLLTIID